MVQSFGRFGLKNKGIFWLADILKTTRFHPHYSRKANSVTLLWIRLRRNRLLRNVTSKSSVDGLIVSGGQYSDQWHCRWDEYFRKFVGKKHYSSWGLPMESFDTKFCIPSIWKHSMFLAPRVDSWGIVPEWIIFHTELLRRHDTFSRTHCKGEKIQNNEVNRIFKSFFFNFFPLAQFIFRNVDFVKKCLSDRRLYRFLVIYFLFFTKKCSIGAKICQDFFFCLFPSFQI